MAAAIFDFALSHFRAKRAAEAVVAFDDALCAFSKHGGLDAAQQEMAHSMRGDCHSILGHFHLAEEDFSSSIRLAPNVAVYYFKRGSARRKLGKHEGAIFDLRRSVEMGCGLGKADLKQLEKLSADTVHSAVKSGAQSAQLAGKRSAKRGSKSQSFQQKHVACGSAQREETAEAEAVRAQLEVVKREQQRLASLTARVVSVALTDGERERSARLAAEEAVEAERRRVEHAVATARRERDRAKAERRATKRANAVAQASIEEATLAKADVAEQRDRVAQYLLCAQAEISATEREARQQEAAMAAQSERKDAARREQTARQQAAAAAVLRKERTARAAAAEAQARAEDRLQQAEVELAVAQQKAAAATAAAAAVVAASADAGSTQTIAQGTSSRSGGECVVCLDAAKEIMLEPCRHVCLCGVCAPRVRDCPVCRAKVRRRVQLYL